MNLDFTQFIPSMPYILKGILVTLKIVILAGIIGICTWYYFIII